MYRPPSQTNFLETLNTTFEKTGTDKKSDTVNTTSSKLLSHDVKNYDHFCTIHGLKQLIQSPIRVTCST